MAKTIRRGERFQSFAELKVTLDQYENENFVNYSIAKSSLDKDNPDIKYIFVRFNCKLFGEHVKTTQMRATSSYKQGCQSYFYVSQKQEGKYYGLIHLCHYF